MKITLLFVLLTICMRAESTDGLAAKVAKEQEAAAVAFERLLSSVSSIEIISLDPLSGWDDAEKKRATAKARLQNWLIVGRAVVDSSTEIAKLKEEAARGIRSSDGSAAGCFDPRHALRFKSGSSEVTILICFHCLQGTVIGSPRLRYFLTSRDPVAYFDQLFEAHGLKVMP